VDGHGKDPDLWAEVNKPLWDGETENYDTAVGALLDVG
jgi:hypothetical protein